jgi:ferredoxin-NADP reductase
MAMLRHRAAAGPLPAVLLFSSRTYEDIIYRDELDRMAARDDGLKVVHTLTRGHPVGWGGGRRRIDRDMLASAGFAAATRPKIFICGPTGLVEGTARSLRELGHERDLIKTERFGPTGG